MKVSIIIDSYNYRRFTPVAIESALSQTYPAQVIVVDDGSTDGSREVIAAYEPRIQAVLKSNGGQASAFNAGWKLASGDIVFLLDSDDALKPNAVESVVAAWRPGYSKVHFPLEVCDEKLQASGARVPRAPLAQGDVRQEVLAKGIYVSPPTSGNVFSRAFLQAVMPIPEPEWVQASDAYLIALAGIHGEIGAVPETLGYYRTHSASTTSAANLDPAKLVRMLRFDINLRKELERFAPRYGVQLAPDACFNHWIHLKLRLASCKLAGPAHPFASDRVWDVANRLVRATAHAPELTPSRRAVFFGWATLVASLPAVLARPLVSAALKPAKRPAWLQSIISRIRSLPS